MRVKTSLALVSIAVVTACSGDRAASPAPASTVATIPSAHESTDPRPGVPTALPDRDAAADAAEAGAPAIVLVPDAGSSAPASVVNPEATIGKLSGKLRRCYQRGLAADRQMKGKLLFALDIDASGAVTSANATQNDGISPGVVSCLAGVLKTATFTTSPPNSHATLQVPLLLRDIK